MNQDLIFLAVGGLAFMAVAGLGLAFSGSGSEAASVNSKRIKAVAAEKDKGGKRTGSLETRRKQTESSLKALRQQANDHKERATPKRLEDQIEQAGLAITVPTFYIGSLVFGVVLAVSAVVLGAPIHIAGGVGFAAALGLPRWVLGMLRKGRFKKITEQFADAIDIIVRGVKSGLPLNECLRVIGRESPEPLRAEFARMNDNLAMGMQLDAAVTKLYNRVPIPEVNFFGIVLNIQQKAGGNLSEALGNLSGVIRSRKLLREKVKALSAEAKASAMIIGSLPIAVMVMVYVTTPGYIMELFTDPTGHMILLGAVCIMGTGIYIMRRMINFDM